MIEINLARRTIKFIYNIVVWFCKEIYKSDRYPKRMCVLPIKCLFASLYFSRMLYFIVKADYTLCVLYS